MAERSEIGELLEGLSEDVPGDVGRVARAILLLADISSDPVKRKEVAAALGLPESMIFPETSTLQRMDEMFQRKVSSYGT